MVTCSGIRKQEVNLVEELVRRGLTHSEAACFLDGLPGLVFTVWSGPIFRLRTKHLPAQIYGSCMPNSAIYIS